MENSTPQFKPNYLKTLREKINQAKKFDQLYERPNTDDWEWLDILARDMRDEGKRSWTLPKKMELFPIIHTT